MAQDPYLVHELAGLSEAEIAKRLEIPYEKLEGLFLAETYHYTYGTSDVELLKRAHEKLNRVLDKHWQQRQDKLPLKNSYEALILASIIEKETAIDEERERVASVFVNRLNKRMRLQTDPTVIYGMGEAYDGNIRKKDLRTPTPYNTYVINGLPPTPIAMAGEASIAAALNPENSSYLYFVASGKGGHVFSKTLAEHNRAVRAYLRELKKR
ncbi:putative aminodeoxychorismate lyase [Vibrio vulnificus]|nr:putative aminodeoxychorismate lyase [Vibrio vulnificus]